MILLAKPASARWNHQDANSLNRVTGLGVEYYNDILSYRDVFFDEKTWEQSQVGFRSSAGSLNKKEFLFRQHIHLRSSNHDAWRLAYVSQRDEEPRQVRDNSALELSYGDEANSWRLGLMGDGHSEKSFADLGMRLHYAPHEDSRWQLIGWSVDTFYNEKKLQGADYRTTHPWSWEFSGLQRWGRSTLRLRLEQDQPVDWYRVSKDQHYGYRYKTSELQWSYEGSEGQTFYVKFDEEKEREALTALSTDEGEAYQDTRHIAEIGQSIQRRSESFQYAVWGLMSETQRQRSDAEAAVDQSMTRQESAFLANWSRPFWDQKYTQFWGFTLNQVKLDEEKREQSTEVKINWGPEIVLGPSGRLRVITTWDIDQLVDDFPFDKQGFHPWGGGYASFFIVF